MFANLQNIVKKALESKRIDNSDGNDDTKKVHDHDELSESDQLQQGEHKINPQSGEVNRARAEQNGGSELEESSFGDDEITIDHGGFVEDSSFIIEILRNSLELEVAANVPPKSAWLKEIELFGSGRNGAIPLCEIVEHGDHSELPDMPKNIVVKSINIRQDIECIRNEIEHNRELGIDFVDQNWKDVLQEVVEDGGMEYNERYTQLRKVWHEVKVLQKFRASDYLVNFLLAFFEGDAVHICLEPCERSLNQLGGTVGLRHVQSIAAPVLLGLDALHRENIVHFDIKPSNILIDSFGKVRICDFDASALFDEENCKKCSDSYGTTILYTSPETAAYYFGPDYFDHRIFKLFNVIDSVANDIGKTDIWSLALTLLEIYTGTTPLTYRTGCPAGDEEMQAEILKYYTIYSRIDHADTMAPYSLYEYIKGKDDKNREILPPYEYNSPTTLLFYKHMRARLEEKMSADIYLFEAEGSGLLFGRRWTTFQDFVTKCLAFDYNLRPSALKSVKHPFFHDYNEDEGRDILVDLLQQVAARENDMKETSDSEADMETERLTKCLGTQMNRTKNGVVLETHSVKDEDEAIRVAQLVEFYDLLGKSRAKKPEAFAKKVLSFFPGGILDLTVALYQKYGHIPRGWEPLMDEAIKMGYIKKSDKLYS